MSDINSYREPTTKAVALEANPPNHATDNGVLFTAVARQLGLITQADFDYTAGEYLTSHNGEAFVLRYPYNPDYCSWDDHLAYITTASDPSNVKKALRSNWMYLPSGDWLGRFVVLDALVAWPLFPLAAISYLVDIASSKENTSGRQLLWLAGRCFYKHNILMRPVLWLWRKMMMNKYPNGVKDLMAIYYTDPEHPFHNAAPTNFE